MKSQSVPSIYLYLKKLSFLTYHVKSIIPPKHAPKLNAHASGGSGSPRDVASAPTTRTIIVVNGMLSTNADASPDTCWMRRKSIKNKERCQNQIKNIDKETSL